MDIATEIAAIIDGVATGTLAAEWVIIAEVRRRFGRSGVRLAHDILRSRLAR